MERFVTSVDHRFEYDTERSLSFWTDSIISDDSEPVLQRAYRAVIALLITSGVRGMADVKTAHIAELAGTTESTLFRHVKNRDLLVANAIDWCWQVVNERVAIAAFEEPMSEQTPERVILRDLEVFLSMYDDSLGRLCGTGALLGFRRSERLVGDFEPAEQLRFTRRLTRLSASLMSDCEPSNETDPAVIATFLTNSLATAWFTWLFDSSSRSSTGLLTTDFVLFGIRSYLTELSTCRYRTLELD